NPIAKYAPSANAAMNTTAETSDRAELLIRSPEVLQRVGKQAHDDDACGNVSQDRNVHAPRVGVDFQRCRRSVKRDAAPHDDPNRAAIGHTAGAERQDRKSKLGTCEQVCKQIRVGFETDADGARNELRPCDKYEASGECDESMTDQQPLEPLASHRSRLTSEGHPEAVNGDNRGGAPSTAAAPWAEIALGLTRGRPSSAEPPRPRPCLAGRSLPRRGTVSRRGSSH